ncbi:hypothetical protein GCM10028791_19580 [Echinicola sediminis]
MGLDSATATYRKFFFKGTHNSYSGNLGGMKREGIATQLEKGLRFFEFDLFSFYTETDLMTTWPEESETFTAFDYLGDSYLLSYLKARGNVNVHKLEDGEGKLIFRKDIRTFGKEDREFNVLAQGTVCYILEYGRTAGSLTIHGFNGDTMDVLGRIDTGNTQSEISTFEFQGSSFVAFRNRNAGTFIIRLINIEDGAVNLGQSLYSLEGIPYEENVVAFEQNDELYLFRHNLKTVTNFKVGNLLTGGDNWSVKDYRMCASDLLMGQVRAVYSQGKFYINSYAANGEVIGAQLIIDEGIPVLVHEYTNEVALLTGAKVSVFPSKDGYRMLLQDGKTLQLTSIVIGSLVLGHDAPGDEVDLTVDNPQSILLKDWIMYLRKWSDANPDHEPLFVMTELKNYEQWLADAKWIRIIEMFQDSLGDRLRFHSSEGFFNEPLVDKDMIVDGRTPFYFDENGSKDGGLLGKVVLYIQPNNNITKREYTNNFQPFGTVEGVLQGNFLQLRRYRTNNKLVSPDWRKPGNYGNDIGAYINSRDGSYITRIFHMESSLGDGQYDNIRCSDVMFAVSDRPYEGLFLEYAKEQEVKNSLDQVSGCD